VSELHSGALSSWLTTGWRLILRIRRPFNIWVYPPGRFFVHKDGGKGDLSDNLNAATPSFWKSDQDASLISLLSEMYPMAVICLIWVRDSFRVAHRFQLSCHISKKSWTLAILCSYLSTTYFFISEPFSVFIVSNSGSAPANIPLLTRENCLTTTFSRRFSPVVFDCFQQITSRPREKLACTPTPCYYDVEYALCHTGEISVLWVRFLLLRPPVSYVRYPKCTANLHLVGVVTIEIWIDLPPVLCYFRWRI